MGDLTPIPRTYPPGSTSWIEVAQPDAEAGISFYGDLFGWEFADMLPPDAPSRYVIATLDGLDVAALAGPADGPAGRAAESTAAWSTYVAVDDADAVARSMVEHGATVRSEPADAGQAGRAATLTDPQGAEIRLWQAHRRLGAQVANVPGAWNFSDLRTTAPAAAGAFYADVLGWRLVDQGWATVIQVPGYGDHLAATTDPGIHGRQAHAPEGFADVIGAIGPAADGEPPHWHVTFTVADRDAAADDVRRLGGEVEQTTEDDWTRKAVVRDPQGARFTVSQFTPPEW
jgi:predicted enzyme related to lactoylglutathione lyase